MNETYSDLREHTLNDIKQVIDFYRLEITDDPETHNTIEGSLAETIAEWVPMDYEQIEITSSSMGDDLIISVLYTNTSFAIDDQFIVVHNELDMFDNSGAILNSMLDKIDLTEFSWNYDFTVDSLGKFEDAVSYSPEIEFNEDDLDLILPSQYISPLSRKLAQMVDALEDDEDEIVRSKPFVI